MLRKDIKIDIVKFIDDICTSRLLSLEGLCNKLCYEVFDFITVFDSPTARDLERLFEEISNALITTEREDQEFKRLYYELQLEELPIREKMTKIMETHKMTKEDIAEDIDISLDELELFIEENLNKYYTIKVLSKITTLYYLTQDEKDEFVEMVKRII